MTMPATCGCGSVRMDGCPGPLSICIVPGFIFEESAQRVSPSGMAMDWPVGTTARLRFSWGTGTELLIPGTVDGSYLHFAMTAEETEQLPRGTVATIDVNYDGDPDRWRPWRTGRLGCR